MTAIGRVEEQYLIGIDEAGRGPLAGPVAVAAVMATNLALKNLPLRRDSKQLAESAREAWYQKIITAQKSGQLYFSSVLIGPAMIDRFGIVSSISQALAVALRKLPLKSKSYSVFLDGGLKAPAFYQNQKTIIGGDAKMPIIALASIVAKVQRDRQMRRLARRFPTYGFANHKGYATVDHYLAILQHGLCPIHRRTFCRFLAED